MSASTAVLSPSGYSIGAPTVAGDCTTTPQVLTWTNLVSPLGSQIIPGNSPDINITYSATVSGSIASATASATSSGTTTISGEISNGAGVKSSYSISYDITGTETAKELTQKHATAINDANIGVGAFISTGGAINLYSSLGSGVSGGAGKLESMSVVSGQAGLTSGALSQVASGDSTVGKVDISTVEGSQKAIIVIDQAIQAIDAQRADLGAVQNRFENIIGNLQNIAENVSAARGRIKDTDFAAETANLSKQQILQQAGTAILAQANQLPQAVLSLLR